MSTNNSALRRATTLFRASAIALAVVSLAIPVVAAPIAGAESQNVIVNTGAGDLNVRAAPSAKSEKIGTVVNRSLVRIVCYTRGDPFSGGPYRSTTNIWNRLEKGGFVTDAMLNTGSDDPVVPRCGAQTPGGPARATGRKTDTNTAAPGSAAWGALEKWFQVSRRQFDPDIDGLPKDLPNAARAAGWTVVDRPEPRSIVVFQPGVEGAPASGHIAWVDTVADRRDGRYISITEAHGNGDGITRWTSRQVKGRNGMTFVLLP